MLNVRIDYPILHALCCCLNKRAREIYWYMVVNYDRLPIKVKELRNDLNLNTDVCYRSLRELTDYNIIVLHRHESLIDFSFKDHNKDIKKIHNGTSPLTRTLESVDDMKHVSE